MNSDILNYFADAIGIIGVIIVLLAYILLQADRLEPEDKSYSWMNLVGSAFIVVSLFYNWNTPAMLVECAWVVISLWGAFKAHRRVA